MAKLSDLKPSSRRFIERYPFPELPSPVVANLRKPLHECRVALVTTAGIHLSSQKPFESSFQKSDCSYRAIPNDFARDQLRISHTSSEFDRSGIDIDLNVVLPVDRLMELVDVGRIGSCASAHYSFMGSLPRTGALRKTTAPALARELEQDRVDLAILTPV